MEIACRAHLELRPFKAMVSPPAIDHHIHIQIVERSLKGLHLSAGTSISKMLSLQTPYAQPQARKLSRLQPVHSTGPGLRLQTGLCMPYGLWLRIATTISQKKDKSMQIPPSACVRKHRAHMM